MNHDYESLRAMAEKAIAALPLPAGQSPMAWMDYADYATPATIIALLDRLEALEQKCILYSASLKQADERLASQLAINRSLADQLTSAELGCARLHARLSAMSNDQNGGV